MAKTNFFKLCRTTHSWLGIFVFPWIILIGLSGVYLNHSKFFYSFIASPKFSESQFNNQAAAELAPEKKARSLAAIAWPNQPIAKIWQAPYHGRPSVHVKNSRGVAIVSILTGHYYLKTRYTRRTYSPGGELLHTKLYWGAVLKDLHRAGWLGRGLGTWIADGVGMVMMIFGLTGSIMWALPRIRKFRKQMT